MITMSLNRDALLGLVNSVDRVVIVDGPDEVTVDREMIYRLRGVLRDLEGELAVEIINHRMGDLMRFTHMSKVDRDWVISGIGCASLVGEEECLPGAELEALIHN